MKRIFLLLFSASEANVQAIKPVQVAAECPDQNIGQVCDGHCYAQFIACKDACSESSCERTCLIEYTGCYADCPCYDNCPDGCTDCPHSICTCKEPQTNNKFYQQCLDERSDELSACLKICAANKSCFEKCFSVFIEESDECPCMDQSLFKDNRYYKIPPPNENNIDYLWKSSSALLNGRIYVFGGNYDGYKIAYIDGCEFVETQIRLINKFYATGGSLVTVKEVHDEVVICEGYTNKCEAFDGNISRSLPNTSIQHKFACLVLLDGQATAVAGEDTSSVETLAVSGWMNEPSHPAGKLSTHTCVSIGNGIITAGGTTSNDNNDGIGFIRDVFLLQNNKWTTAGQLLNTYHYPSMIFTGSYFIIIDGRLSLAVERAEWSGLTVTSSKNISTQETLCYRPIIFESDPNRCASFCSDNFCYV
ncbi:Oidioi.mRNA.OKI2018_I69.chr1.g1053.t1.cds [Oikopleura dioica]|uniref:Oidioi.mRNA.OKI2018_I69.chr1.g1053.t1.cds n=1 Tax=Oikopleura dioica TaxID=34765 RepID=A0ABN7SRY6_OIKDI|nr:Oidioi.mRNA.OKI2018_I69.chr1.g1053.t1.cds [Oikopleura dioica]